MSSVMLGSGIQTIERRIIRQTMTQMMATTSIPMKITITITIAVYPMCLAVQKPMGPQPTKSPTRQTSVMASNRYRTSIHQRILPVPMAPALTAGWQINTENIEHDPNLSSTTKRQLGKSRVQEETDTKRQIHTLQALS